MLVRRYRVPGRFPAVIPAIVVASLLLSGCWDHHEMNKISIVGVMGIDGRTGNVRVTAEIFRPPTPGGADGGVLSGQRSVTIAAGEGRSVLEAIRALNRAVPRLIYTSHVVAIIMGEEYAREGIQEVLDLWQRAPEFRTTAFLLVAKGRADDIITDAGGEIETTIAAQIEGLRQTARTDGRTTVSSVHQVIRGLTSDSRIAVTGVAELVPCRQMPVARSPVPGQEGRPLEPAVFNCVTLTGLAIFREAKLRAVIPVSDVTKPIVATVDPSEGTTLNVAAVSDVASGSGEAYDNTVVVTHIETHVRAETEKGLRIVVRVRMEVDLASQHHGRKITADEILAIQKSVEETYTSMCTDGIRLLQSMSCDAMGFADAVHRDDPKLWASIKDDWDEIFRSVPFEVLPEARLRHAGMTRGPAWKES